VKGITLGSPKCVAEERSGLKASCRKWNDTYYEPTRNNTPYFMFFNVKMRRVYGKIEKIGE
jgi:hypothetical protein